MPMELVGTFIMGILAGLLYVPIYRVTQTPNSYRSIRNTILAIAALGLCILAPVAAVVSISNSYGTRVQLLLWCYLAGLISTLAGFAVLVHRKSFNATRISRSGSDRKIDPDQTRSDELESVPASLQEFTKPWLVLSQSVFALAVLVCILFKISNGWGYLIPPIIGPILGACFLAWYSLNHGRRNIRKSFGTPSTPTQAEIKSQDSAHSSKCIPDGCSFSCNLTSSASICQGPD